LGALVVSTAVLTLLREFTGYTVAGGAIEVMACVKNWPLLGIGGNDWLVSCCGLP